MVDPQANRVGVGQTFLERKCVGHPKTALPQLVSPLAYHVVANAQHEGTQVGNYARGDHNIPDQVLKLLDVLLLLLSPGNLLPFQTYYELLGAHQLILTGPDLLLNQIFVV